MDIENNRFLFYVCAGLAVSGSDVHDKGDADICALVEQIRAAGFSDRLKAWFARARTGQVEVNPYWPRGSTLAAACFFVGENYEFNRSLFFSFVKNSGVADPVGRKAFKEWIWILPDILREIDDNPEIDGLWDAYCGIIGGRLPKWAAMISRADEAANAFYRNNPPPLVFSPNLFTPHIADFVRIGKRVITIAAAPDPETVLHESLHIILAKNGKRIAAYARQYGLGGFADKDKMLEFGYMSDETPEAAARAIEECFVRAAAAELAGCGGARLQEHAEYGFHSVPLIAGHIRGMKLWSANVGELVSKVMKEMRA